MIFKVNDKLISIKKTISQAHINQYAKASGDFNPIHVDEEFGKNSQFKGNIAHGMMIAATISELMTKTFNLAWYETGTMKIRFKAPVFPEDTITTSGIIQKISVTEEQKHYVQCKVEIFRQSGEIAIQATTSVEIKDY
tara:strand:- start:245 stop:658 length:414 start_codon:yes stop_codon:yes gene_type:complete